MKSAIVMNAKAIMSSKGQVVVPRVLREALGLHAGSELIFAMHRDGVLEVKPLKRSIEMFFGRCKQAGEKPLSIEDMDKAIGQAVSDNDNKTK
jgi:AbrB family looped-hinge helix DNA binding protein